MLMKELDMSETNWGLRLAEQYELITDDAGEWRIQSDWDQTASDLRTEEWMSALNPESGLGSWLGGCRPATSAPGVGEGVVWFHGSAFPLIVRLRDWSEAVRAGGVDLASCEFWGLPSHEQIPGYKAADFKPNLQVHPSLWRWSESPLPVVEDFSEWSTWDEPEAPAATDEVELAALRAETLAAARKWAQPILAERVERSLPYDPHTPSEFNRGCADADMLEWELEQEHTYSWDCDCDGCEWDRERSQWDLDTPVWREDAD